MSDECPAHILVFFMKRVCADVCRRRTSGATADATYSAPTIAPIALLRSHPFRDRTHSVSAPMPLLRMRWTSRRLFKNTSKCMRECRSGNRKHDRRPAAANISQLAGQTETLSVWGTENSGHRDLESSGHRNLEASGYRVVSVSSRQCIESSLHRRLAASTTQDTRETRKYHNGGVHR